MRLPLLLIFLGALMNVPFYGSWGGMEDEAVTVLGARLITEGKLPYLDFDTHHSPGSYYVTALFLWLFQDQQLVSRGLACLSGGLLSGGVFLILRDGLRLRRTYCLWGWWLCAATGVTQWPILNYHWFSTIAGLYTVYAMVRRGPGFLAGMLAGVTGWFMQGDGAAVCFAALFTLQFRLAPRFAAGVLLSSAILWGPIMAQVGAQAIWEGNVEPIRRHGAFGRSPYDLNWVVEPTVAVFQQMSQAAWNGAVAVWAFHSLSYLAVWWFKYGLFWVWLALWLCTKPWKRSLMVPAVAAFCGLSFYNQNMLYLNYYTPLLYIALADLVAYTRAHKAATLVAVVYAFQYIGLVLDVHKSIYPIQTPNGLYYTENPAVAAELAYVGAWWKTERPDRGTVFVYPFRPAYYTLFSLKPASRYFMMFPLNYDHRDLERTLADLARNKPEWILRSPLGDQIFKDLPNVDRELFLRETRRYDDLLLRGYKLYQDGPTQIYRRADGDAVHHPPDLQ